jgi:hypothetical protein
MGARSLAFALLFAAACQGPRATVEDIGVAPSPLAGRYRVAATVVNHSHGQGQVELKIELHDPATGRTIKDERDLELEGHERARLVADVQAPPAAWVARVHAEYPPR